MIRIYPSLLQGEPIESHDWSGTLAGWLDSKGVAWRHKESQPVTVTVNGAPLPASEWESRQLSPNDAVEIRIIPRGGIISGIANIIGGLLDFAFGWLLPSAPGAHGSPEAGQRLEPSQTKANQARLGEVVPELAGRFRRFPDYLVPPRRHFIDRREQWLEFLACIGPGEYEVLADDIKIGETPIAMIGDDTEAVVYPPGSDLTGVTAAEHWHTAPEVGGTASGTAGLELSTELGNRENQAPASYSFDGAEITRSDGEYPVAWGNGTEVRVVYPRTYSTEAIFDGGTETYYTVYTGFLGHVDIADVWFVDESLVRYEAELLADLGGGLKEFIFRRADGFQRYWNGSTVPGSEVRSYGSDKLRTILSLTATTLELVGSLFFETGTATDAEVVFDGGFVFGEPSPEVVATPAKESSRVFELDFFFGQGLGVVQNSGEVTSRQVRIEVRRRNLDTDLTVTTIYTYTDNTLDQIGITERIELTTPGRYAFQVRRASAQATATNVRDAVHWQALKCQLPTATGYPNWTTLAVRFRSGGHLGAQAENKVNVLATRILPTLQPDGTWGEPEPTRDISAFVRHIAHTIGYTDDNIDMPALQELHAIWTARGETADHVFSQTTVKEALALALGAGMAELTVADGQIRPIREGVRTAWEQSYSPHNMTGPLTRSFRARRHDDHDGVEVEYTDGETWTQETIICALPGSQQLKLEKLRIQGVTDRVRAWRIGMRRAREIEYRRWEYSFGTELDAMNSEYKSYVALFDDINGYGQSALLTAIEPTSDGALLRLTEPLRWEEGAAHIVGYRRPDGTLAGPWPAAPGPDEFSLVAPVPEPWPTVTLKMELPHVYFGRADTWTFPALVTQVTVNNLESASVSAVNYDARVYADDDNSPDE